MPKFFTNSEGGPALFTGLSTGSWSEDIDLTADASFVGSAPTIPATATGIILRFSNSNTTAEYGIGARKPGSTTNRIADLAGAVNTAHQIQAVVGISSRTVDLYIENSDVSVYLLGYLEAETTFFSDANQHTFNPTSTNIWETLDLSAYLSDPDTKFAIIEFSNTGFGAAGVNFRHPSSTDNRVPTNTMEHHWMVVPVDSSGNVEFYAESTSMEFYLVGEITANSTVMTSGGDVSTATTGSYTPIDLSVLTPPTNTVLAVVEMHSAYSSGFRQLAIRPFEDGSYTDLYSDTINRIGSVFWFTPVTVDVADSDKEKFDAKIESTAVDFYVWGWITEDAGGLTIELSDTINLSDSIIKNIGLNKADTISISDTFSKTLNINKSDIISLADEISKSVNILKSDTIILSDQINTLIALTLSLSDTITMSDSISKQPGIVKSDSITMSDTFSKVSEFVRTFSDQIDMSDQISKEIGITKADIITLSDIFSTSEEVIYALVNFLAKDRVFNFTAKNKTFNFTAKNKNFNFGADPRGKKP